MHAHMRPVILVAVTGLLVVTVLSLDFSCSSVDFWAMSQQREELRQLERATSNRAEARRKLVREWMARRCTLAELWTQFRELDRDWPDYSTATAGNWSEKSRKYQQILSTVEFVLQGQPKELAAAISRLEKEYQPLGDGGER
jgi:hypothetical protein